MLTCHEVSVLYNGISVHKFITLKNALFNNWIVKAERLFSVSRDASIAQRAEFVDRAVL